MLQNRIVLGSPTGTSARSSYPHPGLENGDHPACGLNVSGGVAVEGSQVGDFARLNDEQRAMSSGQIAASIK